MDLNLLVLTLDMAFASLVGCDPYSDNQGEFKPMLINWLIFLMQIVWCMVELNAAQ